MLPLHFFSLCLLTLTVFGIDGISIVTFGANATAHASVALTAVKTLACDWVAAGRKGQVQIAVAITGLAGTARHRGLAKEAVRAPIRMGRQTDSPVIHNVHKKTGEQFFISH